MQRTTRLTRAALAALALAAPLFAQEGEEPDFPTMEEIVGGPASQQDPQARMKELFLAVESKLKDVDVLLTDAAAGDTSRLAEVEDPGIADLLRSSLNQGRSAQKDIEEILEIARQLGQQQSSSSSSSGQQGQQQGQGQQQDSPLNRGQQSQSREQTPEAPGQEQQQGQEQGQEQQQGQGEQREGQDPQSKDGQDPKSPEGSDDDGSNREGGDASGDAAGSAPPPGGADENWGNLPAHVKDAFRSEGRSELPSRYRDWIDDYYKKLNRRARRP